jgi:hypothetical protein
MVSAPHPLNLLGSSGQSFGLLLSANFGDPLAFGLLGLA